MITSTANRKVREVQNLLRKAPYRKEQKRFVVEGVRMFSEAPEAEIRGVLYTESFLEKNSAEIREKILRLPHEEVTEEVFSSLSATKTPQGVLAVLEEETHSLEELLIRKNGVFLVLETIQDPGNLGTMLRAGEGAGLTGIIADKNTADLYNPKVVRSTMGSIFRVPFVKTDDLPGAVSAMKKAGIRVFAADLAGTKDYDEASYLGQSAFLIGNEARGLSEDLLSYADERVRIPMLGKVESLNAAVASAVLLYELSRQRRRGGG